MNAVLSISKMSHSLTAFLSASLIFELDVNLTSLPNYIKLFLASYQNSRNDPAGITATICAIGLQNWHGSTDERSDVIIRRLSTETYTHSKFGVSKIFQNYEEALQGCIQLFKK